MRTIWATYLMFDANTTNSYSLLSDGFGGLLKEIRVHEISLTRMDESSIFHLMTVLLFYSFIQRRFGVNKNRF